MQAQLRRYQNILVTTGIAVILFGVWDTVKTFLWATLDRDDWKAWFPEEQLAQLDEWAVLAVILGIIGMISIAILTVNVWIGRGAILEGRGKRPRRPYIAVTILLVLFTVVNSILGVQNAVETGSGDSLVLNSILIDVTVLYARLEMIWTACKVRRLTREVADAEPAAGVLRSDVSAAAGELAVQQEIQGADPQILRKGNPDISAGTGQKETSAAEILQKEASETLEMLAEEITASMDGMEE